MKPSRRSQTYCSCGRETSFLLCPLLLLYTHRTVLCFLSSDVEVYIQHPQHLCLPRVEVGALPPKAEGIGICRACDRACTLCLLALTLLLMAQSLYICCILRLHLQAPLNPACKQALTLWYQGHDHHPPAGLASHHQRAWDVAKIDVFPDPALFKASSRCLP